jgi:TonB family protein
MEKPLLSKSSKAWPYWVGSAIAHATLTVPFLVGGDVGTDATNSVAQTVGIVMQEASSLPPKMEVRRKKTGAKKDESASMSQTGPQKSCGVGDAVGVQPVSGNPAPIYPEEAREEGLEGLVMVRAYITTTGRVRHVESLSTDAPDILVDAALAAVRQWRFSVTGVIYGDLTRDIPIRFELERAKGIEPSS